MATTTLDVQGLKCPLPVLKAKKAIAALQAGDTLEVLATDPSAVADFQAFSGATGHPLVEWRQEGEVYRFLLRKAG